MTRYLGRKVTARNQYLGHINLNPEMTIQVYRACEQHPETHPQLPQLQYDINNKTIRKIPGEEWAPLQEVLNGIGPIAEDINKHFLFVIKEIPSLSLAEPR